MVNSINKMRDMLLKTTGGADTSHNLIQIRLGLKIPVAILAGVLFGPLHGPHKDPNRAKLCSKLGGASLFDTFTVDEVNKFLENEGVTLTEGALEELCKDIDFSRNPSSRDWKYFSNAAGSQRRIAKAFYEAGETAGGHIHTVLSLACKAAAHVAKAGGTTREAFTTLKKIIK